MPGVTTGTAKTWRHLPHPVRAGHKRRVLASSCSRLPAASSPVRYALIVVGGDHLLSTDVINFAGGSSCWAGTWHDVPYLQFPYTLFSTRPRAPSS
jgi:hypothetical protein